VRQEWNRLGHAVDEVKEDYGEDLLVQTCLDDLMDPSRIWVQVKGTEKDCVKKGQRLPSVQIKAEQVLRWSRSADLVVVVLWDVGNNCGWFAMPQGAFDYFELRENPGRKLTMRFSRDDPFDSLAVEKLAWAARIEHANRSLRAARADWDDSREMELEAETQFHARVYYGILFDFATVIKVAKPGGGFSHEFLEVVSNLLFDRLAKVDQEQVGAVSRTERSQAIERATEEAMIGAMFAMITTHCSGNGAPISLVKELVAYSYPSLFRDELLDVIKRTDPRRSEFMEDGSEETSNTL
jgi:hypothetical protein